MADRHTSYFARFVGGTRDGQMAAGADAYSRYLSTDNGTVGRQFTDLTTACKERIQKIGFVAVHVAGGIEREVYEVVEHRAEQNTITIVCKFVRFERQ